MSNVLPPVRCVTCGKVLGHLYDRYTEMLENGETIENALNKVGLNRPCCRVRLRNPFVYVESRVDEVVSKQASTDDALNAISSSSITIIPQESINEDEIILPALAPVTTEKKIVRKYKAW